MLPRFALSSLALVVAIAPLSACSSTITKPRLAGPGPAPVQRAASEVYDPYPVADGGPKIVGGRPIDFAMPRNEVELSRQYSNEQRARLGSALMTPAVLPAGVASAVPTGPRYATTGQPPGPVVGQAIPVSPSYPTYPTYPATPVATPALPSMQPPVQYRY